MSTDMVSFFSSDSIPIVLGVFVQETPRFHSLLSITEGFSREFSWMHLPDLGSLLGMVTLPPILGRILCKSFLLEHQALSFHHFSTSNTSLDSSPVC